MQTLERHLGRTFTHVIPGEIGGSNSMRPMIVAAQVGLPVVDGDGMGSRVSRTPDGYVQHLRRAADPRRTGGPAPHQVIFDNISDPTTLERYARVVTIQMGGAAGYAFPPMSADDVRRTAIPGTVTLAIAIGDAVLAAREAHRNPVDAALAVSGARGSSRGRLRTSSDACSVALAGVVNLEGSGPNAGETLKIDFQNENLVARTGTGEVLAVVPDLICLVDEDTAEPITTEILRYGLRVVVLGIPAPELLKTPEALEVIGPAAFGYPEVKYTPLAGVFGAPN